ncbi:hypothetical protein [Yoonia sp. TsM2_T14_4]|uniref:hypothetical protein n=1 Tax=Yoonia sp. TsM2_T14_4 TaxID=3415141 RepID=UPI003C787351
MEIGKHIAIRLSQPTGVRRGRQSIIGAHNDLVRVSGECAFGKFGAPISFTTKKIIDSQLSNEIQTFLYVILRDGANITAYRSKIQNVVATVTKESALQFHFPEYYPERPASAIIISEELKETTISDLLVSSSKRPLLNAILSSRTPMMLVNAVSSRSLTGDSNEH